jgi:hypothetical protein
MTDPSRLDEIEASPGDRLGEIEAWWALVARVMAWLLGATILIAQTFGETTDRVYLIVAGLGLMGPATAQAVAQMLAGLRGGGEGSR